MEATRLATKLTSVLAPALPFLLPASPTGQMDTEEIPESALAADRSIWQKIVPYASERPALYDAAVHLSRNSHDAGAQAEFQQELRALLASDAALFEDLKKEVIHHYVLHHFDPVAPMSAQRMAH